MLLLLLAVSLKVRALSLSAVTRCSAQRHFLARKFPSACGRNCTATQTITIASRVGESSAATAEPSRSFRHFVGVESTGDLVSLFCFLLASVLTLSHWCINVATTADPSVVSCSEYAYLFVVSQARVRAASDFLPCVKSSCIYHPSNLIPSPTQVSLFHNFSPFWYFHVHYLLSYIQSLIFQTFTPFLLFHNFQYK